VELCIEGGNIFVPEKAHHHHHHHHLSLRKTDVRRVRHIFSFEGCCCIYLHHHRCRLLSSFFSQLAKKARRKKERIGSGATIKKFERKSHISVTVV